jgi:hypothetical protein
MTRSAAERTSIRAIPRQAPVGPPRDVAFRSQQLALIDVSAGGGADQEGLDLPAQIASLERELRYYRRVIPALTRASVRPRRPSLEQAGELTHLARWLTDPRGAAAARDRAGGPRTSPPPGPRRSYPALRRRVG